MYILWIYKRLYQKLINYWIIAKVFVKLKKKTLAKEYIIGGTGFGSDMSNILQFGLGKEKNIVKISIKTIYGKLYEYANPKINSTIAIIKPKN